jgi:hypothetical protein
VTVHWSTWPRSLRSWISDRDFTDPTKRTLEVRVLLTKNQLSDLQMILQKIVHAAEEGMLKPDSFFNSLRSIASQFGRDPGLATRPEATRLSDLGRLFGILRYTLYVQGWRDTESTICCGADRNCNADNQRTSGPAGGVPLGS